MFKIIIYIFFLLGLYYNSFSQNNCNTAEIFCSDITYTFPLSFNNGSAQLGPDYGCLSTTPNPIWYYIHVDNPGDIIIDINSPTGNNINFICWGPFTNLTNACPSQLTNNGNTNSHWNSTNPHPYNIGGYPSGNTVDCSYNPSAQEWCYIPNSQIGEYYLLMISNYSNLPGTLKFQQIGGQGKTNCCCFPTCFSCTYVTTPCNINANTFDIIGNIIPRWTLNPGYIQIFLNDMLIDSVFIDNSSNYLFTIPNLPSTNETYSIKFKHSNLSDNEYCSNTYYIKAPMPCNENFCSAGIDKIVCGLNTNLNAMLLPGYSNGYWTVPADIEINNINLPNASISSDTYGTYSLIWHTTNPTNVSLSDTVEISFNKAPSSSFILTDNILCFGDTAAFQYTGNAGLNAQFNWLYGNGTLISNIDSINPIVYWNTSGTHSITLQVTENKCLNENTKHINIPSPIEISINSDTLNCSNNNYYTILNLNAIHATSPYLYSYSQPNTPPFNSGFYQVTVTDSNGCSDTSSFTINDSTTMVNANLYHNSCSGISNGSIKLIVTSPIQPATFLWSNSFTGDSIFNLSSGIYSVTVTYSNGCTSTHNYTIKTNSSIDFNYTINNVSCDIGNDGSITGAVTGGTAPYSYLWSNGSTNLSLTDLIPGTYSLTITDALFCNKTYNFTITVNNINIMTNVLKDCDSDCNGSISVSFSSIIPPYNYYWSNGDENITADSLCSGSYSITVIDSRGCTNAKTILLTGSTNNMIPTIVSISDSACSYPCNASISLNISGGVSPYKCYWDELTSTNYTNNVITKNNLCPGNYSVQISDKNNCFSNLSFSIDTFLAPTATLISPQLQYICQNSTAIFNANYIEGITGYWSNNIINNFPFNITESGNLEYIFTTENIKGCKDTVISKVISYPNQIHTNSDVYVCSGAPVLLYAYGNDMDTFHWSQGVIQDVPFIPINSGSYEVTATSSMGCQDAGIVNITVLPLPNAFAGNDTIVCEGSLYSFHAIGGINYFWNQPIIQNEAHLINQAGQHYVTVSNSYGCLDSDSLTLEIFNHMIPQLIFVNDTLFAIPSNYPYIWYDESNQVIGTNESYFIPTISQGYYVVATNTICSSNPSSTLNVIISQKESIDYQNEIIIYPNPTSNKLFINQNGNYQTANMYNYTGKLIRTYKLFEKKQSLELLDIAEGMYFFEFKSLESSKIIKININKK